MLINEFNLNNFQNIRKSMILQDIFNLVLAFLMIGLGFLGLPSLILDLQP